MCHKRTTDTYVARKFNEEQGLLLSGGPSLSRIEASVQKLLETYRQQLARIAEAELQAQRQAIAKSVNILHKAFGRGCSTPLPGD